MNKDVMVLVSLKKTLCFFAMVCLYCSPRPLTYGMTTFYWFSVGIYLVKRTVLVVVVL